ncbi:MAG: O-antigen ligase family protein [Candidatus Omnitrophica bacterium]|nr:O-antigen ligase family protein [Candidatus Omnitrophota bacterium]
MSRRYRQKRNLPEKPPKPNLTSMLELAVYLMLCFQIAATAIYYNGIMHPLVHKMLLGQSLALAAWFFYGLHGISAKQFTLRKSPYYWPLLVLCVWAGVRSFTAPNADAVRNYWIFLNIVCTFPLWTTAFQNRRFRFMFVWTVVFCGIVMVVGCIRQLLMEDPSFKWDFFPAITLSPGTYERQRLGSFMGHNNDSSAFIANAMIYAGGLWICYRRKTWSILFGIFMLFGLIFNILGGSRGVALMTIAAVLLLLIRWLFHPTTGRFKLDMPQVEMTASQKRYGVGFIVGALLLALAVSYGVFKSSHVSLQDKEIKSVWSRFLSPPEHLVSGTYPRVWLMSLLMARDNPLTGVGFSAWPYQYPQYQKAWFTKHPDTVIGLPILGQHTLRGHNDYLQLWAELGFIGLLCLFWLLWVHFRSILKVLQAASLSPFTVFAAAATLATLARAVFAFPFHMAAASCLFIAGVGFVSSQVCQKDWIWTPSWLKNNDDRAKWGAVTFVAVVFVLLSAPNWTMTAADYSARVHGINAYSAKIYLQRGDLENYESALKEGYSAMQHSLELIPNQGKYLHEIGAETVTRGVYDNDEKTLLLAVDYLTRAQESYGFYRTQEYLGMAYDHLFEITRKPEYLQKSEQAFREAAAIMPTYSEGWIRLALALAKSGKSEECVALLAETELRFPGLIEHDLLNVARTEKKIEYKVALYDLAATIKPENPAVLREIELFYLGLERMDRAVDTFTHMAKYQPEDSVVNWLTTLLLTQLENGLILEGQRMLQTLREESDLQSVKEIWYYSGIFDWLTGNSWDAVLHWSAAMDKDVRLEQLEAPLSVLLSHNLIPLNLR